mgnify:CR=1 FL=1
MGTGRKSSYGIDLTSKRPIPIQLNDSVTGDQTTWQLSSEENNSTGNSSKQKTSNNKQDKNNKKHTKQGTNKTQKRKGDPLEIPKLLCRFHYLDIRRATMNDQQPTSQKMKPTTNQNDSNTLTK